MISFILSKNGHFASLRCPADEADIEYVQHKLEIADPLDTVVKVTTVNTDIPELKVLEDQDADMDFLNLLGRFMYGLDAHEYKQLQAGLFHDKCTELKDIINVAANAHRYSVIDTNDLRRSGLEYELDLRGAIPTDEVNSTDYIRIANDLINSGTCKESPYGLIHVNEDLYCNEFFDGEHMPPYFDRMYVAACTLENKNGNEFVMLPVKDREIERALKRLGADSAGSVDVVLEETTAGVDDEVEEMMRSSDVFTINRFSKAFDKLKGDETDHLYAAAEWVKAAAEMNIDLNKLADIAENLDAFTFYPNALSSDEIGMTLLEEHQVPEDLWDYFDTERCGEDFIAKEQGRFTSRGYVGVNDFDTVQKLIGFDQSMGGMV